MKKINLFLLIGFMASLTSCEAVAGIFKAGFNAGVIVVILVIVLLIFGAFKLFGGGGNKD